MLTIGQHPKKFTLWLQLSMSWEENCIDWPLSFLSAIVVFFPSLFSGHFSCTLKQIHQKWCSKPVNRCMSFLNALRCDPFQNQVLHVWWIWFDKLCSWDQEDAWLGSWVESENYGLFGFCFKKCCGTSTQKTRSISLILVKVFVIQ